MKKLAEKSSELIRKEGEFQLKRKADSETIKEQQKELGDSGITWRQRRTAGTC
jgi:hypothetical protein